MNKLFDLRFVIGLFFLVVGLLLVGYSLLSYGSADYKKNLNLYCGLLLLLFGGGMLAVSVNWKKKH